jgi:hypothetical protein
MLAIRFRLVGSPSLQPFFFDSGRLTNTLPKRREIITHIDHHGDIFLKLISHLYQYVKYQDVLLSATF